MSSLLAQPPDPGLFTFCPHLMLGYNIPQYAHPPFSSLCGHPVSLSLFFFLLEHIVTDAYLLHICNTDMLSVWSSIVFLWTEGISSQLHWSNLLGCEPFFNVLTHCVIAWQCPPSATLHVLLWINRERKPNLLWLAPPFWLRPLRQQSASKAPGHQETTVGRTYF